MNLFFRHFPELAFPSLEGELKGLFLKQYNKKSIILVRMSLILTLFISLVPFSFLDTQMLPSHKNIAWGLRFYIQGPVLLLTLYLTFQPVIMKRFQLIVFLSNFIMSSTVLAMIAISGPHELAYTQYYTGVMLLMTATIVMRMRFKATALSLTMTICIYLFVSIFIQKMHLPDIDPQHPVLLATASMFLMSVFITIVGGAYLLETVARQNFLSQLLLEKEKEVVEESSEEMNAQNERIEEYNSTLQTQNDTIKSSHQRITDSISYAQRIQGQLLPKQSEIAKYLPHHFIFYKPKDVVSGDFYWFVHLEGRSYLAVVDCTGHGVPGAFLSFIGHSTLNKAVFEKGIRQPSDLLNYLNTEMAVTLKKEEGGISNGMDLTLIVFDENKDTVCFAGARNPLVVVRDGELMRYKTDLRSVGEPFNGRFQTFTQQSVELQTGDNVYLFSDGFADQFGGENNKKYLIKRFRNKLLEIHSLEPKAQKQALETELNEWRNGEVQTDDVLVIGLVYTSHTEKEKALGVMKTISSSINELMELEGFSKKHYEEIDNIISEVAQMLADNHITREEVTKINHSFGDGFLENTLQGYAFRKPYGYAGDFLIIDKIYTYHKSSVGRYKKWDEHFHVQSAPKAVRNRKEYFKKMLLGKSREKESIELLNLASGPARDVAELYEQLDGSAQITTTCVEMDVNAIEYAEKVTAQYKDKIKFINKNVFKFSTEKKFDVVWSAGLFDYFDDRTFVVLLKKMKEWCTSEGEIIIGNFNEENNPSRDYMEVFGEWYLHHRTEGRLIQLALKAGFDRANIAVAKEPENVNLFLHIKLK